MSQHPSLFIIFRSLSFLLFLPLFHLLPIPGCKLLFKQDFIKRLGLKCVTCNHCSQLCKRGVTRQLGGMTRDFCGDACAKKFHDWYYKVRSHSVLLIIKTNVCAQNKFLLISWKRSLVATRRRGVTAVRCRVTWPSLWCGEQRWSSSVTSNVCWSSTASRTSPLWSRRKAPRTPAWVQIVCVFVCVFVSFDLNRN